MNRPARARTRWWLVVVFAIGMAWVEAASVYYLRVMVGRVDCMVGLNGLGVALALYLFMADSLRAVHEGLDATRTVLPTTFNWPVFVVALVLIAARVAAAAWRMRPMSLLQDIRSSSV